MVLSIFFTGTERLAVTSTLRTAVEQTADDEGWAHLGKVGQYISNNSSFSPVNYGYKKQNSAT